jgi:hypothetical protein
MYAILGPKHVIKNVKSFVVGGLTTTNTKFHGRFTKTKLQMHDTDADMRNGTNISRLFLLQQGDFNFTFHEKPILSTPPILTPELPMLPKEQQKERPKVPHKPLLVLNNVREHVLNETNNAFHTIFTDEEIQKFRYFYAFENLDSNKQFKRVSSTDFFMMQQRIDDTLQLSRKRPANDEVSAFLKVCKQPRTICFTYHEKDKTLYYIVGNNIGDRFVVTGVVRNKGVSYLDNNVTFNDIKGFLAIFIQENYAQTLDVSSLYSSKYFWKYVREVK